MRKEEIQGKGGGNKEKKGGVKMRGCTFTVFITVDAETEA